MSNTTRPPVTFGTPQAFTSTNGLLVIYDGDTEDRYPWRIHAGAGSMKGPMSYKRLTTAFRSIFPLTRVVPTKNTDGIIYAPEEA
jgi:hypothetical protein